MASRATDVRGLINLAYVLGVLAVTLVSSWILGVKLHRRIRRELGKDVDNEIELTSLNTWMKVEEKKAEKPQ